MQTTNRFKSRPRIATSCRDLLKKQRADRLSGAWRRQRGNPLYLAFLIRPLKSRCSFAFLRSTFHRRLPFSLRDQRAESVRRHACGLQSPGGVHAFLRDQHRAVACSSTVVNKVVQAVIALSSSRDGSRQDSGHSLFAAPPGGRSPRARVSISSPLVQVLGNSNYKMTGLVGHDIAMPAST